MQQSDIELTISRFSKIEQRLVHDLGATEKNGSTRTSFINRLSEVEHLFAAATIQRLRSIAAIRNKLVHGDITSLPNREQFIKDCEMVDMAIDLAMEKRDTFAGSRNSVNSSEATVGEVKRKRSGEGRRKPNAVKLFVFIFGLLIVIQHFSNIYSGSQKEMPANGHGPQAAAKRNESVYVEILSKGVVKDTNKEFLFCQVKFFNLTGKNITGMRGILFASNQEGNILHTFNVHLSSKHNGTLKAKSSFVQRIRSSDEYSDLKGTGWLFKKISFENLKFGWRPEQIVYEDGTETAK
jgi:hypothetical protein